MRRASLARSLREAAQRKASPATSPEERRIQLVVHSDTPYIGLDTSLLRRFKQVECDVRIV